MGATSIYERLRRVTSYIPVTHSELPRLLLDSWLLVAPSFPAVVVDVLQTSLRIFLIDAKGEGAAECLYWSRKANVREMYCAGRDTVWIRLVTKIEEKPRQQYCGEAKILSIIICWRFY